MPSTYAHYVFGRRLLSMYPEPLAAQIRAARPLFDIGVHGPDLLFYFKPLFSNAVNSIGYSMHGRPASEFFGPAKEVYQRAENKRESLAYLMGFVSHFALDSACHGYIENKIRVSNVRHTEIESEFDRTLLLAEGKEPLSARLTEHIAATRENAAVIAPFFKKATQAQVYKALRSMRFYNNLLRAPHFPKRQLVLAALRLSGNYTEMHGMMIAKKPIPACKDSNLRLSKLFEKALAACVPLCEEYIAYLRGEGDLPAAFSAAFGPAPGWENIPVLSLEEEKKYEV